MSVAFRILTRTYRIGRIPVPEFRHAAHHEDVLHVVNSEFDRSRGSKLMSTHLANSGRRGLVEQDRYMLCHIRIGPRFTPCTTVHRDRLVRTDGDRQATIDPDPESANTMSTARLYDNDRRLPRTTFRYNRPGGPHRR